MRVRDAFEHCRRDPLPFDALYRWAEHHGPETTELVVSLLLELHESEDELLDELLTVDEHSPLDPATTVGRMRAILETRFEWLAQFDLDDESGDAFWWVISDNTEEPRRTRRDRLDPEHHLAAERLSLSDRAYTEPRDNACSPRYLPLLLQRFQLAIYGMDNFKPKSTDWLRVTLFQGAPRLSGLGIDTGDDWVLPARMRCSDGSRARWAGCAAAAGTARPTPARPKASPGGRRGSGDPGTSARSPRASTMPGSRPPSATPFSATTGFASSKRCSDDEPRGSRLT